MKPSSFIRWIVRLFACIGVLAVALYVFDRFHFFSHPVSPVTNFDYPLVQLTNENGLVQHEIRKGESKLVEYGLYTTVIPATNASFPLWKNNRGRCNIRSANGVLLVETDRNSSIFPWAP